MKEQAIQKINKIGKISAIVTTVCKVLVIASMVICLAATILCMVFPRDMVKVTTSAVMNTQVDYSALGIEIPQAKLDEMKGWMDEEQNIIIEETRGGFGGGLTYSSTSQSYAPQEITIDGSVVTVDMVSPEVVMTLRNVAGLMVAAMVGLAMTLVTLFFVGGLCKAFRDCQSPFEENVIQKMQHLAYVLIPWTLVSGICESILTSFGTGAMNISFSVNLGVVLVVLIVLVLVYIFKYGAVLQQESDETL